MTIWLDTLNNAWDELRSTAPVARQYRTKLISKDVTLDILAGMRATDDAPCLMLQTTPAPDALFELGGMRLGIVPDQSGTFLVLSLEDSARRDLFSTICADVVAAAASADKSNALIQFLARLDAWRQFLRDRRSGLSRSDTIGLIGELLVLENLLTANPRCLGSWQSPNDGLQDFLITGHALEIKTSLGPASAITISSLDQLDTSGLHRLDLLHVRLNEMPNGRSLQDILVAINACFADDQTQRAFENALLRRGLMPDDQTARATPRIQLRAIDAYSITPGFPRLIRADLSAAIIEATYTIDVRGIAAFAGDATAALDMFVQEVRHDR
jgi:hypothetical protein